MNQTNRLNRTRYRLYAPVYDLLTRPFRSGRRRAIEQLDLEVGDRVLIPGCGTGEDLEHLPPGVEVVALDITPAMVRRTARRADSFDLDATAMAGDAQRLPFDDGTFDAVLLHLVLSVVPDPQQLLAEVARVTTPSARISIFDKFAPAGEDLSIVRRALNPVASLVFSDITRQLEPMTSPNGFRIERRESVLAGLYTVACARLDSSTVARQ